MRLVAGVAQLAERQPSKLHVASSNLVSRSTPTRSIERADACCRTTEAVPGKGLAGSSCLRPVLSCTLRFDALPILDPGLRPLDEFGVVV